MEIRYTEKTVARHSRLNYSRSRGSGRFAVLFTCLLLLALTIQPGLAADYLDQLRLTGTIKGVNAVTGFVTVDVVSSSCSGMRIFKADKLDKLEAFVDQKVAFFIDSNKCDVKETYTIITERGLRK